ncbi:Interferon-induced GTP-binding protein Mx2 [Colletotrichum siamense]|uniref:Interferon-induced GTP-binding protein Mx2 n=1 Tax=Colletotrichum siamense TaxID=690259 RepID=A0A9P5EJK2_COLSI|nr:Interferon-induced GTP-binding protein Mx2 [Colletotrichum siamense]KAF4846382.1 Interferon-induced GTP-binding protein Mx2 [Colletotrichum siamense]
MAPAQSKAQDGLGNRHLLDKIDKLRELGISKHVPLPQLVVVGDQSSGKSSVLESLTGYYFPRSVGLCTRHATEIVCRRELKTSIVVTIHPFDPTSDRAYLAKSFRHVLKDLRGEKFAKVLNEASEVMGLKSTNDKHSEGAAFSKDILRVEICGPEEEHLTVIDVPGIFENPQEGFSTARDVALVKSMVKGYIKDSRTVILAVIPCNVDVATQTILTYAAEADPEGKRTLGVLTKPDLVSEKATREAVLELVKGKRRDIQLGYYIVKNRGADDKSSSKEDRDRQEKLFFGEDPWVQLDKMRLGIPALRGRLRELLMERTRAEFPKVRDEINVRLAQSKVQLKALGPARAEADEQRVYLGRIVTRFGDLKNFALSAYYTSDLMFDKNPELKLVTRVREMNTAFSEMFFENAHTREFEVPGFESAPVYSDLKFPTPGSQDATRDDLYELTFDVPSDKTNELEGILAEPCVCDAPEAKTIMTHLENLYLTTRGYELGTIGGQMLPTAFKEQSRKWESITLAHVSNAILVVHHFIRGLVREACTDRPVREALWSSILDDLVKRYQGAMDHAKFLIHVERYGLSMTYNPVFDRTHNEAKTARIVSNLEAHRIKLRSSSSSSSTEDYVRWEHLKQPVTKASGLVDARQAIHDVLKSYYSIATARFVDMVCTQVVDHFLVCGEKSPLNILSPSRIYGMSSEQLDIIVGEDLVTKSARQMLLGDIKALEKGSKALRS